MVMIITGVVLLMILSILSMKDSVNDGSKGGAVVIIGFIPIVFGKDKSSAKLLLLLSIVLITVLLVLALVLGQL